jgi:hypothetical protein
MAIYESPLFYAMAAHDATLVMPDKVKTLIHTKHWPEDLNARAKLGANATRKTKRVMEALHPTYEDAVLALVDSRSPVQDHVFDVETKQGNLISKVVSTCGSCKQNLSAFMGGRGGWEPALASMGQLVHWLVDIWNPLSLQEGPQMDELRQRFMNDLQLHAYELPFWWTAAEGEAQELVQQTPYLDSMATAVEAERRKAKMLKPIADRYILGNGWPAARPLIEEWYGVTVNAIARALLYCTV